MALWVFLAQYVGTHIHSVYMGKQIPMAHSAASPHVVFILRRKQGTAG